MKTSNKILLGAFIVIVLIMIFANLRFKSKVDEIKAKQEVIMQHSDVQQADTVSKDSTSVNVQININE